MKSSRSRMTLFSAPDGIGPGGLPTGTAVNIPQGHRIWFLSVLGDSAVAGSFEYENAIIAIPAGTAFTLTGSDFPSDCENYDGSRRITFYETLGPVVLMTGPIDVR